MISASIGTVTVSGEPKRRCSKSSCFRIERHGTPNARPSVTPPMRIWDCSDLEKPPEVLAPCPNEKGRWLTPVTALEQHPKDGGTDVPLPLRWCFYTQDDAMLALVNRNLPLPRAALRADPMSICGECRDRLDTEIEYVTAMCFGGSQDPGDGPGDNFFRPVKSMILNHVGSTPSGTGPSSCDMQT